MACLHAFVPHYHYAYCIQPEANDGCIAWRESDLPTRVPNIMNTLRGLKFVRALLANCITPDEFEVPDALPMLPLSFAAKLSGATPVPLIGDCTMFDAMNW